MTLRAQTGAGVVTSNLTVAAGSQDGVTYTMGTFAFGGNNHVSQIIGQTSINVSTSAVTILTTTNDGSLIIVSGSDGTNKFADTIMANLTTVNVIGSGTAAGTPGTRTYSNTGAGVTKLAMSAGTYSVCSFGLVGGQR